MCEAELTKQLQRFRPEGGAYVREIWPQNGCRAVSDRNRAVRVNSLRTAASAERRADGGRIASGQVQRQRRAAAAAERKSLRVEYGCECDSSGQWVMGALCAAAVGRDATRTVSIAQTVQTSKLPLLDLPTSVQCPNAIFGAHG